MKIYVKAQEQARWQKAFELSRSNTTPLLFWRAVKKAMTEHGEDITDWIPNFDEWSSPASKVPYHTNRTDGFIETMKSMPYDFQLAYSGQFNVIMEFDFMNMRKGSGYFYFASNQGGDDA